MTREKLDRSPSCHASIYAAALRIIIWLDPVMTITLPFSHPGCSGDAMDTYHRISMFNTLTTSRAARDRSISLLDLLRET